MLRNLWSRIPFIRPRMLENVVTWVSTFLRTGRTTLLRRARAITANTVTYQSVTPTEEIPRWICGSVTLAKLYRKITGQSDETTYMRSRLHILYTLFRFNSKPGRRYDR